MNGTRHDYAKKVRATAEALKNTASGLSCSNALLCVATREALEKAERKHGREKMLRAAKKAEQTPYDIFYWLKRLGD